MEIFNSIEKLTIFLVKPAPPLEVQNRNTPLPEGYKYNWEPIGLKILSYFLNMEFSTRVDVKIWHIMNRADEPAFLEAIKTSAPGIIGFTEIDLLISEVNRLTAEIRSISPPGVIVAGGKHCSLLRKGDHIPFKNLDWLLPGEGVELFTRFVRAILEGKELPDGIINGKNNFVKEDLNSSGRFNFEPLNGPALRQIEVENHSMEEYIQDHQHHPAIHNFPQTRTAPLFTGNGCPHDCYFCQSPLEYGSSSHKVTLRPPEKAAEEAAWMFRNYGVNNFFSLEPNLNLKNLLEIYKALERKGVRGVGFSGFIRGGDILSAYKSGFLAKLIEKGLKVLSIGLDLSFTDGSDIYNKNFTFDQLNECLEIGRRLGILILGTFVGNPELTAREFRNQLETLKKMPVSDVDIRLAISLKNTIFYENFKKHFIHSPEEGAAFYDKQNYRYQTIAIPGKISPEETYALVKEFYSTFLQTPEHKTYVKEMVKNFPYTRSYFRKQYKASNPGEEPPFSDLPGGKE